MKFALIVAAVLTALILQYIMAKRGAGGIAADAFFDRATSEPDEEFTVVLRIENRSRFIFPFVRFTVSLPDGLEILSDVNKKPSPPSHISVTDSAFLWPRKAAEKQIKVKAAARGIYRIGTLSIETGDFLGLSDRQKNFSPFAEIAVYPVPLTDKADTEEVLGGMLGDFSVRRYIYDDPVLISGFREYSGREPMKSVSWLQSARTGRLMVKKYDFTAEPSVSVILDTYGAESSDTFAPASYTGRQATSVPMDLIETCFSAARSVCGELEKRKIEYDFILNAGIGGANCRQHYFEKGCGPKHFYGIMTQLAYAVSECAFSDRELLKKVADSGINAGGIILIMPGRTPEKEKAAAVLSVNPSVMVKCVYAAELAGGPERAGGPVNAGSKVSVGGPEHCEDGHQGTSDEAKEAEKCRL